MEWSKEEQIEIGGITRIETYAWYVIHGGNADEEEETRKDPLRRPTMLQKQLADYKKAVKRVKKYAIAEESEWVLETSYSSKHRLKEVAIENRQAAIRGRPNINSEYVGNITKMIMAIKGGSTRKTH